MTNMILSFSQLAVEKQSLAGGKGSTLAQLYQAGYPVPDGFVILPTAFAGDELMPKARAQIQKHLARLRIAEKSTTFAVRSSALSEDSVQASFAGEFETILDVRTDEEIHEAIRTVRQSRLGERVQIYSQAKGIEVSHEIAVVVQRMVPAEMSGVLFTADPISGSWVQMTVNFVHGQGGRLVSGLETGKNFTFKGPKGQYQGSLELRRYARKLYKLAKRVEREFGIPQDIEWAIANGKLYLLQSRPITTLIGYKPATSEWNDSLTGDYLWSNVNFGEAISDVMTPLTWSGIEFMLDDWVFVPGMPMVGNIGGCPYFNISVLATLLQRMGKSRQDLLSTLEGTLYMRLPDEMEIPLIPISRWTFLKSLFGSMRVESKQRLGARTLGS